MGSPKRPRRTWGGGRQGVGAPRGGVPPAEALPHPKGRVVRDLRRRKRRTARPPHRGSPRPGGPPDSAPTSRGALGSTSGALELLGGTCPWRTPTRVRRGHRRRYPRRVGVGQVTQARTEAYAPGHQAFVTVDKRSRRLALLPASSAGQIGPGRLPVQGLVEVQQLAGVRMCVRACPFRHVGEVKPHQAPHYGSGQMPEVSLGTGGGIPHPRHLQHPLGSEDGRLRGRFPPAMRSARVSHYMLDYKFELLRPIYTDIVAVAE